MTEARRPNDPRPWEWMALGAFLAAIAALLLGGCSPRAVQGAHTEYVFRDRNTTDFARYGSSDRIYVRDSIRSTERQVGDTIYIKEWRDRVEWKDREVHDTVYRERHDTTYIEIKDTTYLTKYIEKPPTGFRKVKLATWWWIVAALAASLAVSFILAKAIARL